MLAERKAESLLKERYIHIVKQIDASVVSIDDLRDHDSLVEELRKLFDVHPNIVSVALFDLPSDTARLVAAKSRDPARVPGPLGSHDVDTMRRGDIVAELETSGADRFWNIVAPIQIGRQTVGVIRATISTREFDALVAHERRQAIGLTTLAALAILAFLLWLVRRTITDPIHVLVRAMARAEDGDLHGQVSVRSRDELGRLTEQFNRMLRRIQQGDAQIRQFNEELLRKVNEATSELNRRYEELQSLNRALAQARLQLAHTERLAAAGQVATSVAHQIGTPLHSILGHLHRLRRDQSDGARERRLRIVEAEVERVVQVIRELLDTVRKPAPRMEPVQINTVLDDLFHLITPSLTLSGIKIRTHYAPHLPTVVGDSGQLQEVFLNLLTNAIDAMPGGGELVVTTGARGDDGQESRVVQVTISDTGSGIDEADIHRIFEPFFTTKPAGKGTGLGLSIVHDTIRAHHGRIAVSSHRGIGTTFTVHLPTVPLDAHGP